MTPVAEPRSAPLSPRQRSRRMALTFAGGALAVVLLAVWYAGETAERRAVQTLPQQERAQLYQRTLHTLTSSCDARTRPSGLDRYCAEQAAFVVQFPECDAACRAIAVRHHPGATR